MKRDTPTIINAASRDDLYHVKDNLLGYAFCVKLLSLLLYRLRAIGVPCPNFPTRNESLPRQFLVELRC